MGEGNWILFRTTGHWLRDFGYSNCRRQLNQPSCTAQESFQLLQLWPEASTLSDQPPPRSSPDQSRHPQFNVTSIPLPNSSAPEPPPSESQVPEPESEPFSAASSSDMPETHPSSSSCSHTLSSVSPCLKLWVCSVLCSLCKLSKKLPVVVLFVVFSHLANSKPLNHPN